MEIIIKNQEEILNTLDNGHVVEGRLWMEKKEDGECVIYFGKYNRKPYRRPKEHVLFYLEHGRVTESAERIKMYESVPKKLGTAYVGKVLQREAKSAREALSHPQLSTFNSQLNEDHCQ